jgi:hypothetical protein
MICDGLCFLVCALLALEWKMDSVLVSVYVCFEDRSDRSSSFLSISLSDQKRVPFIKSFKDIDKGMNERTIQLYYASYMIDLELVARITVTRNNIAIGSK